MTLDPNETLFPWVEVEGVANRLLADARGGKLDITAKKILDLCKPEVEQASRDGSTGPKLYAMVRMVSDKATILGSHLCRAVQQRVKALAMKLFVNAICRGLIS